MKKQSASNYNHGMYTEVMRFSNRTGENKKANTAD